MSAPYHVFGSKPIKLNTTSSTAANALGVQVTGRLLPEGFYTLTVVAANSPTDLKTFSFAITNNCYALSCICA
jgi:hypothetical protein